MKPYYQPKNFRHELSAPEGCAPRVSLKPDMKCGLGVSASQTNTAATGAVGNKTGPSFIIGGSNGISFAVIGIVLAIGAAIWFFVTRKSK